MGFKLGPSLVRRGFEAPLTASIRKEARFEKEGLSHADQLGVRNGFISEGGHALAGLQLKE
jgi:hypothetical protein